MAQHDYSIANQTASNARADINNALSAIVSNNSGASAPSTTFANQWWYDTTSNKLKFRNEANTAWIEVGELNQTANTFNGGMPSGAIQAFAMSTAPSGWLKCNGQAISRTTYAALFSTIGTTYGNGNGSTTFNVPDLRGEFIRGWDDSRGIDSGRTMGSTQADQMQQITGSFEILNRGGGSSTSEIIKTESGAFVDGGQVNYGEGWQGEGGSRGKLMEFDSAESPDARAGDETRPRNVALNYCIKY